MQNNQLEKINHSASHILAQAVLNLYPGTKLAIGPAIKNGFYYDFDLKTNIAKKDLGKIEKEMQKIINQNLAFKTQQIPIIKAKKMFHRQPYKLEIINDLAKQGFTQVSIYRTGKDFVDLCQGPHIKKTSQIKAFKLISVAGAYWKGDEKNKMLTRIYGTAFPHKATLKQYLKQIEEAKKKDHRIIGNQLDLFSIDPYVGPGLILWHPKLSIVREEIESYWRKEHRKRGYQYVYTPHLGLANLWQTSGHLDFFKEGMYPPMAMTRKNKSEKTTYFVKPMNCPFHVRIYKSRPRSYKDLPIRLCELGTVYRYEESGVLHGMLRVRGLTQDDAHIICTEKQLVEEVNNILDFALEINKVFGFEKLNVYLSVRDPKEKKKYVGEEKIWKLAEEILETVLNKKNIPYQKDPGGAKFYGPAIDLKAVDAFDREWQGTTIQLDFNLPARFKMSYIGEDGKKHTPVMLHRTLLGAMERFVGTLIEHYGGAFPIWLAPTQVIVIPVSEKQLDYGQKVVNQLLEAEIRTEINKENQTLGNKIRQARLEKIPYIAVVGQKEKTSNSINLRLREGNTKRVMKIQEFIQFVREKIDKKKML